MPRETQGEWKEAGAWLPANTAPILGWAMQMREMVCPGPLTLSRRLQPPPSPGKVRGSRDWLLGALGGY